MFEKKKYEKIKAKTYRLSLRKLESREARKSICIDLKLNDFQTEAQRTLVFQFIFPGSRSGTYLISRNRFIWIEKKEIEGE